MRDYRVAMVTPVVVKKTIEKPKEIIENNEKIEQVSGENVIHLSINDSVGLKESFG